MSHTLPDGIFAASVTPFTDDLALDADAFTAHVRWLLDHGCDGVLLFGTTGEGLSLSVAERIDGLDAILDAGVAPERVLVGTGALALPDAVRLTQEVTARGVGGVLVLPPFHVPEIAPEGVFRTYDQLIQRVGDAALRLYFYHFPQLTGVSIPFDVIQRLQDAYAAQIAGIKDSSGEWDHTEALCRDFPDLQVFAGTERLLLPTLKAGGAGCISATANLTASLARDVRTAWQSGEDARAMQSTLTDLRARVATFPTIPALKQILAWRHRREAWATVRPPLAAIPARQRNEVRAAIDTLASTVALPGSAA